MISDACNFEACTASHHHDMDNRNSFHDTPSHRTIGGIQQAAFRLMTGSLILKLMSAKAKGMTWGDKSARWHIRGI